MQSIIGWLKKHSSTILILGLTVLLYLKNCNPSPGPEPTITVVHDTVWVHHDSTIYSKPEIITKIVPKIIEIPVEMKASDNCDSLKTQYNNLVVKHLTKNITTDTLKIDSLGTVSTIDTVQGNQITGRKWEYSLKEKIVTNTITIREPYKPKNQFYTGVETGVTQQGQVDNASLGVMLKNKKDNIIGVSVGYNFPQNSIQYTLKYYAKIHL